MKDHFLAMDEEGYFVLQDNIRLSDQDTGYSLLEQLKVHPEKFHSITSRFGEADVYIEPFDKPLVAQQVFKQENSWELLGPYGWKEPFLLSNLCLDEWDRFHGLTDRGIPFVLSRKAQAEFFNLLDSFTDDSVTSAEKTYTIPPFYLEDSQKDHVNFWEQNYNEKHTPWDLDSHHPSIESVLPQLKILKSRVLNLGCGRGHDAAYLAKQGHIATGVDISEAAIKEAKELYKDVKNLNLEVGDAFEFNGKFDLCFEHTTYCAVGPSQRRRLVKKWHQCLDEGGFLLAIFFIMPRRSGPPYGASEWEVRELLEGYFRPLYWKRWQQSPGSRQGSELVVYAQKEDK